jgi:hypothetical protein
VSIGWRDRAQSVWRWSWRLVGLLDKDAAGGWSRTAVTRLC